MVLDILVRRAKAENADDRYVFSNHRHTCVADRAKKAAAILCKGGVSFHFRAHDLRRTAASYMGEAGVDRFHIAHVLNHRSVTHSTVTAIYDRYRYDKEKRAALEKWAEVLCGIVDVKPAPTTAPRATRRTCERVRVQAPGTAACPGSRALSWRVACLRILRNNLRVMRKLSVLAALFPTVRGDVLAATLTQPEKWWYLSELAQFLGTSPSSLQRELKALVDGGILETRREGTRAYFKADTGSPVFPGAARFDRQDRRGWCRRSGRLSVHSRGGSPARSCMGRSHVARKHARSDIDLLVVGDVGLADLTPALRKAEGPARPREST
jgi:DNA-binding transcriptional ArsR family regulator